MSFLFPAFLIGALAAAIPVVLHFMRRDVAPEVPFSAVRLLHASPIDRTKRRRLRDMLLLAARVAAVLLLAAAFARPYAPGVDASTSGVRVVAIDRSFSMAAPGRFERALELARTAIDEAPALERVAVIAFDDRAEVRAQPGAKGDARAALAGLTAGFGATRYGAMIAAASDLAGGASGRLIVVTDLQRAGWEDDGRAALPSALTLEVRDVGAPPANLALSELRQERRTLVATLRSHGPAREVGVRLEQAGRVLTSVRTSVPADGTARAVLPLANAQGAAAVVIDDGGGTPADDVRHLLLGADDEAGVLVVTGGASDQSGFYVQRALQAAADEEGDAPALRVLPAARVSALTQAETAASKAVVLLSTRGLDRPARESLVAMVRGGTGLVLAASPDVEADVLSTMFGWQPAFAAAEAARSTSLAATDLRHPVFRPFGALVANLGQVRFQRLWDVAPAGWEVAGRFTDGAPALLEREEGRGRVLLFASDLDRRWNDFPLHPVFVPFLGEAVRYVSAEAAAGSSVTVGEAPPALPRQPGVHRMPGQDRLITVNVDSRESGTAVLTAPEFENQVDRISLPPAAADVRARQAESRQSLWMYGLGLMLATLVVESLVGRAR